MLTGYKTIIGLVIAAAPNIAVLFGFDVSPSFSQEATDAVESIITIIGLCIAFYGRIVAQAPLWLKKK